MLVRELGKRIERLGLVGEPLLVAVSGGIDSSVLLTALTELPARLRPVLSVGHVDHGLRGEASDGDARWVGERAAELGLVFRVARIDPRGHRQGRSSRERPTLQESARELRYGALLSMADRLGGARIATAHHADDQAETVLLRLLRGTGPDGLGGIPEQSRDGRVVRPLLFATRAEIETFAAERRLSWREDASNADLGYTRNRLREHWLPALAGDFNPRLLRAIGELAEAQRRDSEWIEAQVEREAASRFALNGVWLSIETKDWSALPEALARRLAREALRRCGAGRHVSHRHIDRITRFLASAERAPHRTRKYIELPGQLRLADDHPAGPRIGPIRGASRSDPNRTAPNAPFRPRNG